ncbi:hypothetical protein HK097_007202 [Rhizophlyctis rosea]|uniref:Uncharacterized protein n=1 Tax=Rhizophlyctis rosea TaxID=64517 RepID=A0AAD5SLU6_9FUNG|nr:hypothetical protein HK097_007202 [Rhizophlyctis rosea]
MPYPTSVVSSNSSKASKLKLILISPPPNAASSSPQPFTADAQVLLQRIQYVLPGAVGGGVYAAGRTIRRRLDIGEIWWSLIQSLEGLKCALRIGAYSYKDIWALYDGAKKSQEMCEPVLGSAGNFEGRQMVEVVLEFASKKKLLEESLCPRFQTASMDVPTFAAAEDGSLIFEGQEVFHVGNMDLGRADVGGMQETLQKIEALNLDLTVEE